MVRLGQKLHELRLSKGLSLEDVTRETKIRPAFLNAIERGEYHKLPASSYAQGFIANYAEYLGLSKREALALYRREFDDIKAYRVLPERFTKPMTSSLLNIKVQQYTLIIIFAALIFLGYLIYSYKDAFINPHLEVNSPKELVVKSREITVKGKTNQYATVTIDNFPVSIAEDGTFQKTISVFPGKTNLIIKAINRFGKFTIINKEIEYKK